MYIFYKNLPRAAVYLLIFLPLLSSCGYALVGRGRTLPDNVQSIAIPIVSNKTTEPSLELIVSNVLREQFIFDGRLKVFDEKRSDILLDGEIRGYALKPVSFDAVDNVTKYWVEIVLWVKAVDTVNGVTIIEREFSGKWDFDVSQEITITETQRIEAIKQATKIMAQSIISILIEGF